jgi:hypothetical protein
MCILLLNKKILIGLIILKKESDEMVVESSSLQEYIQSRQEMDKEDSSN